MEPVSNNNSNNLRWWILLTVIIGTFLGRLDQTVVNLALPKIIDEFGITVSAASWIATAYILANAIFVPIWGKLADNIGRKKVYVIGFIIFIIGSVLAGLAWNLNSMIIFRIIQAIAASTNYPASMAIVAVTFRNPKERAEALGIWSSSFAAAVVFGPLIGGPLIDNLGWRWVFFINLPVGIIGLAMALKFVKESTSEKKTKIFDWWGAITLGIALSALVLVLDKGQDWGWLSAESMIAYLICIVFGILFYKIDVKHPEPIVDFKFFKNSVFVSVLFNNFIIFMAMMGGMFIVPIFVQLYMGLSATETGYMFMPMAFMMMISAPLGGSLTGKVRASYVLFLSTLVAAIGLYLFVNLDVRSTAMDVLIPMSIMAFGMGFGMAQRTNLITVAVPHEEIGVASSVLALARNIAGAFGIALFGTIITSVTESKVLEIARETVINTKSVLIYKQVIGLIILKAQISSYHAVFIISTILLLLGAVSCLFIKPVTEKIGSKVIVE
jgi:EmrB/QacA subfamily drug resistance transporter